MLKNTIRFFLENKLVAFLLLALFIGWGISTSPFELGIKQIPKDPVSVDAIPDIGENQQIVFSSWPGRSPQDVEDQISYPLTSALLGIPGVKSIRSNSMFGFSSIYIIFDDNVEFYWSRSRILEKLNSLPANTLPQGVQPSLGPDATALGQIYWYTLEGRDEEGNATGGWDLHELRTIQDYYVRFGLSSASGVAEVASIGGYVKEYLVEVDPEAMKSFNISLEDLMAAIKNSNIDIGAQTIEINKAEYFVRGIGYLKNIEDIENAVIREHNNVAVTIADVAYVNLAPASRRGILDKSGAEVVGGVVVSRFGANPLEVIQNVKEKIAELEPGLPSKELADGTISKLKIIPFYDRTQLINETIGTLQEALSLEILITVIVVILMLLNLRSSILVSSSLPVAVLMCFIAMKYFGVDANIVALSGIAIAIGTMVDMGIVLTESMVKRLREAPPDEDVLESIYQATVEVASAVITAVSTTVISFLPVFTMQASEGKLFRPLAYTKTFALIASIIVAITIIPPLAHSLFSIKSKKKLLNYLANGLSIITGGIIVFMFSNALGSILIVLGLVGIIKSLLSERNSARQLKILEWTSNLVYACIVAWLLAKVWMPLGVNKSSLSNFSFIIILSLGLIGLFYLVIHFYEHILRFLLKFKMIFLILVGFIVYQGFIVFKNTGEEFMPSLDEGSFLLMPTSMPHSGMEENLKNLRLLDMAVSSIPEVESVIGKAGRVNSALDPAPMSMYENVIQYKTEYKTDNKGHRIRFKYEHGEYIRDDKGNLIEDKNGRYFRQWRDEIRSPDDIWNEIVKMTKIPGVTSAPKLQPIETRLVMLQTGMRAPMGIKIQGPDLQTIEDFGLELEKHLKDVQGVKEAAVFADRIVGKPYLLLNIDREAISRHGLSVQKVQKYIQTAIGGMSMTTTVEGRERYSVRLRYPRELRDDPEILKDIYIPDSSGAQIRLGELVDIDYEQGAQSIKSEDGFLISYVLFDREKDFSEVEVVNMAQSHLSDLIEQGELEVPAATSYRFAGNYEQQIRANKRLSVVVPIALSLIFLILYFQFRSISISIMVFTGVFIAFAGGFIMIGLYDTSWFLNFEVFGVNMRELFQIRTVNLSVAVWVGFLALFGIATDDGVLVATFLRDSFKRNNPKTIDEIRDSVVEGGLRRVRPAMMTTATTILALLPILSSTGRGSDIMLPMAIPSFGGMSLQTITMFTVPVLFALWHEWKLKIRSGVLRSSTTAKQLALIIILITSSAIALKSQSLDSLLIELDENNLELEILNTEHSSTLYKAAQVGEFPDPEVNLAVLPLPVETRLGSQVLKIGGSQMIPWKGLLNTRKEIENLKSATKLEGIELSRLEIQYRLKKAYLELYELDKSKSILEQNLDLLNSLKAFILSKVESGKTSSSDVLRTQIKISEIEQELNIIESNKTLPLSEINQLLNRPLSEPVIVTDSFSLAFMSYDTNTISELIRSSHPMINNYSIQEEISRKRIALNTLDSKPDIGLGLDYIMVNERSDATPQSNGRDIVQLRASIKVPLHKDKYNAKKQEEELKLIALNDRKENVRDIIMSDINQAFAKYEIAILKYELYNEQIEILRSARSIVEADYSADSGKFDELLNLEQELINYQLKILKAIVDSHKAKIRIEKYIKS